jgi:HK97 family phage portal protein
MSKPRVRPKAPSLMPVPSLPNTGGVGGVIRESFPGAWQMNAAPLPMSPPLLSFSAVYSCVNVISSDIAKLPVKLWRKLPAGGRELAINHPIYGVLQSPNPYQTHVDFFSFFLVSLLLAGNAYAIITRDQRGVPARMDVLNPYYVRPLVAETGDIFYQVTRSNSTALVPAEMLEEGFVVPARDIIHHRIMCVDHPLVGVTPLYAAAMSATVGVKANAASAEFFANMARPAGILTAPGKVSPELAKRLTEEWDKNYGPGKSGKTAMLGDGLKWERITLSAVDSQLIDLLRWGVSDVARVYRVPSFLLGDLDKVTYRNSETLMRAYYSGCLQYHIEALEARLDTAFNLASDVEIEFDIDAILRSDLDVRFTAYKEGIQSGFLTINEARAQEGLKKVDGGDEPMMQVQFAPLSTLDGSQVNQPPPAAPAPEPPAPPPTEAGTEEASIASFVRFSDGLREAFPEVAA